MITTTSGVPFEAIITGAPAGIAGTIVLSIYDPSDSWVIQGASGAGITEPAPGTYRAERTVTQTGSFMVRWVRTGATPLLLGEEELTVTAAPFVGTDHYFTLSELRAADTELASTTQYPDAALEIARDLAETQLEQACGVAFVPRAANERIYPYGSTVVFVDNPRVRSITSVLDDAGRALVGAQVISSRGIRLTARWPLAGATISYTHGYNRPPSPIKWAALIVAKTRALTGPVSERATQYLGPEGGVINLATPGLFGSEFGLPDVDEVVRQYSEDHVGVA